MTVGFLIFGFWGGLFGFLSGLAFDSWKKFLSTLKMQNEIQTLPTETALLTAMVILAKAFDLPATSNPPLAIAVLKKAFTLEHASLRYIGRVMAEPALDKSATQHAVSQLAAGVSGKIEKMQAVLSCLIDLAKDGYGHIDRASMEAIRGVANTIGMHDTEFTALATIKGFLPDAIYDPYQVLGLPTGASLEAAAKAYRRLMQEYHPDRWQGKSAVALARAQEKSVLINDAYLKIKKSAA